MFGLGATWLAHYAQAKTVIEFENILLAGFKFLKKFPGTKVFNLCHDIVE